MCFAMRVGLPSGMGWSTDQRHQKHIETGANNKQLWIGRYHFTVTFLQGCSFSLKLVYPTNVLFICNNSAMPVPDTAQYDQQ
jgi:hypothetical protein